MVALESCEGQPTSPAAVNGRNQNENPHQRNSGRLCRFFNPIVACIYNMDTAEQYEESPITVDAPLTSLHTQLVCWLSSSLLFCASLFSLVLFAFHIAALIFLFSSHIFL